MRPRTRAAGLIACAVLAACAVTAGAVARGGGSSTVVIAGEIGEPQEDHMVEPAQSTDAGGTTTDGGGTLTATPAGLPLKPVAGAPEGN